MLKLAEPNRQGDDLLQDAGQPGQGGASATRRMDVVIAVIFMLGLPPCLYATEVRYGDSIWGSIPRKDQAHAT